MVFSGTAALTFEESATGGTANPLECDGVGTVFSAPILTAGESTTIGSGVGGTTSTVISPPLLPLAAVGGSISWSESWSTRADRLEGPTTLSSTCGACW